MMVICIFSFLLCESGYRYINFIYLCQNKSLVSLFFSVVTVFNLIGFCSYLYDCLPSSFVFLFLVSSYRNLGCWFEIFFYNTSWHELKCVPPEDTLTIVTLRTWACDFIWKQGLCLFNQIKMRLLGYTLIQYNCCPYKKKKMPHEDRNTWGERHVTNGGRD